MGLSEQLKEQPPGFQKGTYSRQMNQRENKGAFLNVLYSCKKAEQNGVSENVQKQPFADVLQKRCS